MAQTQSPSIEDHFHLLEHLRQLAPEIDASKMLKKFLDLLRREQSKDGLFSAEFVKKLFNDSGIADKEVTDHLIKL